VQPGEPVRGREDERVVREIRVEGQHDVAGAGDRADVVDVRLQLGRVRRVVVELDDLLGHAPPDRALRDRRVVRPEHAALVGQHPLEVLGRLLVGDEQGQDVTRPRHRQHGIAGLHRVDVGVALNLADPAGLDGVVHLGERCLELRLGDRGRVDALLEGGQADGVAHLVEVRHPSLELVGEEGRQRGQRAGLLLVEPEAGHPRLPRRREMGVRVERAGDVDRQQVRHEVRHGRAIEGFEPAETDEPRDHPVRQHDDVPGRRQAGIERPLQIAREEFLVAVDRLDVVHLDPGLGDEPVEGRMLVP
jgi:hypothetical protein